MGRGHRGWVVCLLTSCHRMIDYKLTSADIYLSRLLPRDQCEDAGVLENGCLIGEGADFEAGEEAGAGDGAQRASDVGGVVTRDVVEAGAARDTIEVEAEGGWRVFQAIAHLVEGCFQVLARSFGVAQDEADGVADLRLEADCDDAVFLAGADDIAHDELAALDRLRVFVNGNRDEDVGYGAAQIGGERAGGFGEYFVSRAAVELYEDVVARGGHAMRRANQAARDSVGQRQIEVASEQHPGDRVRAYRVAAEDEGLAD